MDEDQLQLPIAHPWAAVQVQWIGPDWGYHVVRSRGVGTHTDEYTVIEYGPFDDGSYLMEQESAWLRDNALRFPLS